MSAVLDPARFRRGQRLLDHDPRYTIGVACALACGCVGAVIAGYDSLPDVLPVSRWNSTDKSPFVALRIPIINLLSTIGLGAIWTAFDRTRFPRAAGFAVMAAAATKSIAEAIELLLLPDSTWLLTALIAAAVVTAVAVALATSRRWLKDRCWRTARWTPRLTAIAVGALVGILGLNLAAAI